MMLASRFSPGRLKGAAVRVMVQIAVDVRPPRLSATELVSSARSHLGANRPDSALAQVALALDTALTHPTDGERLYALLVRSVAASRTGRDSARRADLAERSEEHTSELQSQSNLVCRLLLEKKNQLKNQEHPSDNTALFARPSTPPHNPPSRRSHSDPDPTRPHRALLHHMPARQIIFTRLEP